MRHSPPRVRQGPAVSSTDDTDSWFNLFSLFLLFCLLQAFSVDDWQTIWGHQIWGNYSHCLALCGTRGNGAHLHYIEAHILKRFCFFSFRVTSCFCDARYPIQREKVHSCGWSDRPAQLEIVRSALTVAPECPSLSECPWPKKHKGGLAAARVLILQSVWWH